jgi:methyl-accepting chemotaxis protein
MDKVTQSNAVSAEESAGAAQQLNAEAEMMKQMVGELLQLVGSSWRTPAPAETAAVPVKKIAPPATNGSPSTKGHNGHNGHAPAPHKNGNGVATRHSEIPMDGDFRDF